MENSKEQLINDTTEDKKKLLFHLIFSALYIIVLIIAINGLEQNLLRTPIMIISPVFIFIHVMLVKKQIWLLEMFGFDEDEDEDEEF